MGTWSTHVVLWDVSDPAKEGDPRYWFTERELEAMLRAQERPLDPDVIARVEALHGPLIDQPSREESEKMLRERLGKPKGISVEKLREESGGEVTVAGPAPDGTRIPLPRDLFEDSDPLTTYVIAGRRHTFTPEEREAMPKRKYPPEVDKLRKEWVTALDAGSPDEPELRERYDAALEELGGLKHTTFSAWLPSRAAEIMPAVFVQDERPDR